jgi:hypothetical protein
MARLEAKCYSSKQWKNDPQNILEILRDYLPIPDPNSQGFGNKMISRLHSPYSDIVILGSSSRGNMDQGGNPSGRNKW